MEKILLIIGLLATFLFGFLLVRQFEKFRKERRKWLAAGRFKKRRPIRIGVELVRMPEIVTAALAHCTARYPYMTFQCNQGDAGQLLQELYCRHLDIAILRQDSAETLDTVFSSVPICEPADTIQPLCAVWNNTVPCKDRDRVVTALASEYGRLKSGYCDYQ